ncbi:hypothetical protein D3C72_893460 [compost metagenome]
MTVIRTVAVTVVRAVTVAVVGAVAGGSGRLTGGGAGLAGRRASRGAGRRGSGRLGLGIVLGLVLDLGLGLLGLQPLAELGALTLLLEVLLDVFLHLGQRLGAGGLAVDDLDDVVAELALDQIGHLAGLQAEGRLLELGHHAALAEVAEVAALGA